MIQTELLPKLLKEKEIQDSLLDYLVSMGFIAIRINSGVFKQSYGGFFRAYIIHNFLKKFLSKDKKKEPPQTSKGFPDVLALRGDSFFLFEVKAGTGGKISESQKDFIELAKIKNIKIYIINELSQAIKVIEEFYG